MIKLYKRTLCFCFRRIWSDSATRLVVIMIFLGFLFAYLAAVDAQVLPVDPRLERNGRQEWKLNRQLNSPTKGNTVIENKNVNIIVNVDPKDVAKELFNLIQNRLDGGQNRRSAVSQNTIEELERIVSPVVNPTRRSHKPSAFELAYDLDHITRKALMGDRLNQPTLDDEIVTRDVVAQMMLKLKTITENSENATQQMFGSMGSRSMQNIQKNTPVDDDEFINVSLRIRKSELLKGTTQSSDDYS